MLYTVTRRVPSLMAKPLSRRNHPTIISAAEITLPTVEGKPLGDGQPLLIFRAMRPLCSTSCQYSFGLAPKLAVDDPFALLAIAASNLALLPKRVGIPASIVATQASTIFLDVPNGFLFSPVYQSNAMIRQKQTNCQRQKRPTPQRGMFYCVTCNGAFAEGT